MTKKYQVEIKELGFLKEYEIDNLLFYDPFADYIIAETAEEALEIAKDCLEDAYYDNIPSDELDDMDVKKIIEEHAYRIWEIDENEDRINKQFF